MLLEEAIYQSKECGNYKIFEPISLKILLNAVSDEFSYTSIDKMRFGICQMAAKHLANP